jgi:feruloyl-CoA synthase
VFPDIEACRKLVPGLAPDATPASVIDDSRLRAKFASLLQSLAAASPGSSTRVMRAIVMAEPPSMDKGEMTDKGSINQRAVLKDRAALVEQLYASAPPPAVIAVSGQV